MVYRFPILCLSALRRLAFLLLVSGVTWVTLPSSSAFSNAPEVQPDADSYVVSGRPDQSQPADLRVVWVGYNQSVGYGAERALFKFDLSALPANSVVASAQLSLYLSRAEPSTAAPMSIQISRLNGEWTEAITWNLQQQLVRTNPPAVVAAVGTQPGWYTWDLREVVQSWAAESDRGQFLTLLATGDESTGQHERAFWSKDCKPTECDPQPGKRPKLVIQLVTPTPTPPPTPTSTPTPTPSPTPSATATSIPPAIPTPGLAFIQLSNEPRTQIAVGEEITYTLSFRNGPHPLMDLQIVNPLPTTLQIVPESLRLASSALMSTTSNAHLIQWRFLETIAPNQSGKLVYRLARPIVPTDQGALTIRKRGPSRAKPQDLIRYDLAVTNHTTTTLTNLVITDTLPTHAHYIAGGTRIGNTIQWYVTSLAPSATITKTFVVTASQTITNVDYQVRAGGGLTAIGQDAVVTTIGDQPTVPVSSTDTIIHPGGYVTWRYADTATRLSINPVYNPSFDLYLPLIRQRE